jgi:hypothetical protein
MIFQRMKPCLGIFLLFLAMIQSAAAALPPGVNEDESKVPPYTLPDPLICQDGAAVKDARVWREKRRPELLRTFETEMYGKTLLGRPSQMRWVTLEEKKDARGGRATRLRIAVLFDGRETGPRMELLVYLPLEAKGPAPVFLGLNFEGNYATTDEQDIPLPTHWLNNEAAAGVTNHLAVAAARGHESQRWQYDYALAHGYGVVTACYCEIDPDFHDGFTNGVHVLARPQGPGDWASIGAWAWGLSRALDVLETLPRVDAKRVIVMGHSRLGKTALWAGAQDERFAATISNDSGAGGAALSKRIFGERIENLNKNFPHWFCANYARYNGKEDECAFDQHELIALLAPRPVLINSATEDRWADPRGEFLAGVAAAPVYRLLGTDGIARQDWPPAGELVSSRISYFLRPGKHDVTLEDWKAYVAFADRQVKP